MVSLISVLTAMVMCALAEWSHARRMRRVAGLVFGPGGFARGWVRFVAPLRVLSAGAVAWGLVTLLDFDHEPLAAVKSTDASAIRHVVIALDVSPSMQVVDSGLRQNQSRADRARDVLRSILERLDLQRSRVSLVAFYTKARPVVIDSFDPEVIANVLADLPLEHAFAPGKTDLYASVQAAAELATSWREGHAGLIVVSDGDSLPTTKAPSLPRAYSSVLVVGVGDPLRGTFIDEHSSRQDVESLERLALRLNGTYHDANVRHVPSGTIASLTVAPIDEHGIELDKRHAALWAVAVGSFLLAVLPVLLACVGTSYRPWHWRNAEKSKERSKHVSARPLVQKAKPTAPVAVGQGV
jgi:Ca-activated chloride channel homolog